MIKLVTTATLLGIGRGTALFLEELRANKKSLSHGAARYPTKQWVTTLFIHLKNKVIVLDDEVGDLGEPANYKTAMLDPNKVIWQGAIDEEMKSMKVNKVWILIDRPPNAKVVRSATGPYVCVYPQNMVRAISTESRKVPLEAAMEAIWIRKFVGDLGVMPSINKPINMYCDNSACNHIRQLKPWES
ncbi:hypothetical protein Tco_1429689 [Tanacetum coccineum]